jgi:hypothetical protein
VEIWSSAVFSADSICASELVLPRVLAHADCDLADLVGIHLTSKPRMHACVVGIGAEQPFRHVFGSKCTVGASPTSVLFLCFYFDPNKRLL